jgi:hypothetical protein
LVQIWENILYLWVFFILLTKKKEADIHTEILYVPIEDYLPYTKYDRFTRKNSDIDGGGDENYAAVKMLEDIWNKKVKFLGE